MAWKRAVVGPSLVIRCSVEAVNRRHICLPSSLSDWALCLQHAPSSSLTQRVHFASFSLIRMWCYTKPRLAHSLCVFKWLYVSLYLPVSVCVTFVLLLFWTNTCTRAFVWKMSWNTKTTLTWMEIGDEFKHRTFSTSTGIQANWGPV